MRRDARRTRDRLLRAAGALLAAEADFTLADVAGRAGVSTATAYRHFTSAADIAQAYVAGFVEDLGERIEATGAGLATDADQRLLDLCGVWVQTVLVWGPPLAHLRSAEGFLARRARGEPQMSRSLEHIEPAVRDVLARRRPEGVGEDELAYALAVWNALADPREVLDQRRVLGWSPERIAARLHATLVAAITQPCAPAVPPRRS